MMTILSTDHLASLALDARGPAGRARRVVCDAVDNAIVSGEAARRCPA